MKRYIIGAGLLLCFTACRKEEIPVYSGPAGIAFYRLDNTDSLTYSFAYQPLGKDEDTIFLNMRVLGKAENFDREIKVVAGSGSTAREGIDYKLPDVYLPAGDLFAEYPIVVYNTPEMLVQSFSLIVQIVDSKDLLAGATGRETGGTVAIRSFKISVSNKLEKPAYWSRIEARFGAYSETKFRFMISTLGITDFSIGSIGNYGYYNYPLTLQIALTEYESANGPLVDEETGLRVTF